MAGMVLRHIDRLLYRRAAGRRRHDRLFLSLQCRAALCQGRPDLGKERHRWCFCRSRGGQQCGGGALCAATGARHPWFWRRRRLCSSPSRDSRSSPRPAALPTTGRPGLGSIASLYIANLALLALNLPMVRMWIAARRAQRPVLGGASSPSLLGVYSDTQNTFSMVILLALGVVGFLLRRYDFRWHRWCSVPCSARSSSRSTGAAWPSPSTTTPSSSRGPSAGAHDARRHGLPGAAAFFNAIWKASRRGACPLRPTWARSRTDAPSAPP